MKTYRHGDIGLHPIDKAEGELLKHNGSFVLALGEHTGHKHVITVPDIADMDVRRLPDGSMILTLRAEGVVTHEEHRKITVAPGTYKMVNEREFDYALNESRQVID